MGGKMGGCLTVKKNTKSTHFDTSIVQPKWSFTHIQGWIDALKNDLISVPCRLTSITLNKVGGSKSRLMLKWIWVLNQTFEIN